MQQTLCIIGIGLIGGSVAMNLRARYKRIIGIDHNSETVDLAKQRGLIDEGFSNVEDVNEVPDLVVIAVPVAQMEHLFVSIKPWLQSENTIVTDVGSTKATIVSQCKNACDGVMPEGFVPGHPIAGSECSGVEAALPDLFQGRKVILTPLAETSPEAIQQVNEMWLQTGATLEQMSPQHHDEILALTSHLPHVLAYTMVHCMATHKEHSEIFQYAAGGFSDFTRIASSSPEMWRDICLANSDAILSALDCFNKDVESVRTAIKNRDHSALKELFLTAKSARDQNGF